MRPLRTFAITGATAGVTLNLGFRPMFALVINNATGASAFAIQGMAAGRAALNVAASGGGTDTGGANIATSDGLTLGSQSVTVGASALPNTVAGFLLVLG